VVISWVGPPLPRPLFKRFSQHPPPFSFDLLPLPQAPAATPPWRPSPRGLGGPHYASGSGGASSCGLRTSVPRAAGPLRSKSPVCSPQAPAWTSTLDSSLPHVAHILTGSGYTRPRAAAGLLRSPFLSARLMLRYIWTVPTCQPPSPPCPPHGLATLSRHRAPFLEQHMDQGWPPGSRHGSKYVTLSPHTRNPSLHPRNRESCPHALSLPCADASYAHTCVRQLTARTGAPRGEARTTPRVPSGPMSAPRGRPFNTCTQ
jgi:hypothetical protein